MCSCQRTPPACGRLGLQPLAIQFGKFVIQVVSSRAARFRVVGVTGVEPVTLRLSSACSNQLSYTPIKNKLVELRRVELLTYSLQSYRSTN